jgi:hypothetical protein
MGFYQERQVLSGTPDSQYNDPADFDGDVIDDVIDAANFSFENFTGPVDQSTQPGSQGPLGGSTDAVNPLA